LETKEKVARIGELLTRKDAIVEEIASHDEKSGELAIERDTLDAELHQLLGVSPQPASAPGRQMKCSVCGELGHNSKRHQTEA
jgi:hypothetical protein